MTGANEQAPKILDVPIGPGATGMRGEFDSLGTVEVPAHRYWAAQTQRSLQHFNMPWGHHGWPYDGASMNPARSFGPDLAIGNLSTWWVYLVRPVASAVIAVGVATCCAGRPKPRKPELPWKPLDHGG